MRTRWDEDLELLVVTLLALSPVVIATIAAHRAFEGGAALSLVIVLLALYALITLLLRRRA